MNKSFENDSRSNLFLPSETVEFKDTLSGKNYKFNVYEVLGVGGSGITYDVADPSIPSKHYALKEFLPEKYSVGFVRIGAALCVDESLGTTWNNYVDAFLKETDIQNEDFPKNNGESGKYFLYPVRSFKANNTAYILYDTEACVTLKDKLTELRTKNDDNENASILTKSKDKLFKSRTKKDNSNSTLTLETVLKYFIDICSAVDVLHSLKDPVFHLDISDNNIMVGTNDQAKLTDFGSAIRKSAVEQNRKETLTFTNEFSPIEQKVASSNGELVAINERTDIYAICAVLYKCVFGKAYEPLITNLENRADSELSKSELTGNQSAIRKVLDILKKGLCGNEYRYKNVSELKDKLKRLKSDLKEKQDSFRIGKKIVKYFAIFIVLSAFTLFLDVYVFTPTPTVSANIDSVYARGDDITFNVFVTDKEGISNDITYNDFSKNIETIGFDFEKLVFDSKKTDNNVLELFVTLENVSTDRCGKKQLKINDIYRCNKYDAFLNSGGKTKRKFGKTNKHETFEFELVNQNIECVISEPSVTKVNSGKEHNVTYRVFFKSPVECNITELSSDNILSERFDYESLETTRLNENTFNITLKNITGSSGTGKRIIIPAAVAKSKDGKLYSKETTSQEFEIVDEYTRNDPISLSAFVEEQNLRDGGFVYFKLHNYSKQEYINNVDESKIIISGFKADVMVNSLNNTVYFNNLQIEDINNMQVVFDEGCFISRENGSRSEVLVKKITEINSSTDKSIPSVSIGYLGNILNIKSGSDMVFIAEGSDEKSCFLNRKSGMFDTNGFTYDKCEVTISGLSIRVVYYNIKPTTVDGSASVTLKNATFIDESGNTSREVDYDFEIK